MKKLSRQRRVAFNLDLEWLNKRHTGIFAGAQRYANARGWTTIIDEFVDDSSLYDGVIGRASRSLAEWSATQDTPVVNVWHNSPALDLLPGVFPDSVARGRLRAEHLLSRGFRNFATLTERDVASKLEVAEFVRLIRKAGSRCVMAEVPIHVAKSQAVWKKTEAIITSWMDRWELPVGVHVSNDFIGRIVVQKCIERGWRVPEDVGIVAGVNEEAICEQLQPSLSSVEIGYERIGFEAAKLLDQLMESKARGRRKKQASPPVHLFIPPQGLIVRESTDFYSVEDEVVASALEFISANSHRNIGQDDVATAVAIGTRTLQERFRRVLDRPIVSVIRQVRIDRAKRELIQGNQSIKTVSRNAGFSSPERMNEVFRRVLGVSPSDFRKDRQSG